MQSGVFLLQAFARFVRWYEEPALGRQFPLDYPAYLAAVPGWWPRRPVSGTARAGTRRGSDRP